MVAQSRFGGITITGALIGGVFKPKILTGAKQAYPPLGAPGRLGNWARFAALPSPYGTRTAALSTV